MVRADLECSGSQCSEILHILDIIPSLNYALFHYTDYQNDLFGCVPVLPEKDFLLTINGSDSRLSDKKENEL